MTYSTSNQLGVDLTAVWTAGSGYTSYNDYPPFEAGQVVVGQDGTEWVYCSFAASATQYDWIAINENFAAASGTKALADTAYKVGWLQVSGVTANSYAWVATRGSGASVQGRILASSTSDSALWTTTTAGVLGTTSASQTKITGVVAIASSTTTTNQQLLATFPTVVQPYG